MLCVNFKLL